MIRGSAAKPWSASPGAQALQVARDRRQRVGAQHRRGGAVPFAQLGQDVGADHHRNARHFVRQDGARALLVRGIDLRPEEGDRDCVHAQLVEARRRHTHVPLVERRDLLPAKVDPPADAEAAVPGDQRLRPRHADVERLRLGAVHELENVAESLGREQARDRAVALDDGVGADGRAVNDAAALGNQGFFGTTQLLARQCDAAENALEWVLPVAQRLEHLDRAVLFVGDRDVGERATDVDADPVGHVSSREESIVSVS